MNGDIDVAIEGRHIAEVPSELHRGFQAALCHEPVQPLRVRSLAEPRSTGHAQLHAGECFRRQLRQRVDHHVLAFPLREARSHAEAQHAPMSRSGWRGSMTMHAVRHDRGRHGGQRAHHRLRVHDDQAGPRCAQHRPEGTLRGSAEVRERRNVVQLPQQGNVCQSCSHGGVCEGLHAVGADHVDALSARDSGDESGAGHHRRSESQCVCKQPEVASATLQQVSGKLEDVNSRSSVTSHRRCGAIRAEASLHVDTEPPQALELPDERQLCAAGFAGVTGHEHSERARSPLHSAAHIGIHTYGDGRQRDGL